MRRKAMTRASAILLGAGMLIVGLINLRFPAYGSDFLRMMSSVYPGFHDSRTFGAVIVGTIYGIADGAIMGFVFSSLYRWVGHQSAPNAGALSGASVEPTPMRRAS
jgi:hypothetical protein